MNIQYFKNYSPARGRDMECKSVRSRRTSANPVYPMPGRDVFFDFENFHMTDVWAPWINSGEVARFYGGYH